MKMVSRETDCQRSDCPPGTRDFNLTPIITHLKTENRQNVWLTVKRQCREKPECVLDRPRSLAWEQEPGQHRKEIFPTGA